MLKPLWRFYRWYDDLAYKGRDGERFLIFFGSMATLLASPYVSMHTFDVDPNLAMGSSLVAMTLVGFSRVYWLHAGAQKRKLMIQ